jgi:mRNA interferase YafQ
VTEPLQPVYTKKFDKDVKKVQRRNWDMNELKEVIIKLIYQKTLEEKYNDHKLIGNYEGRRECHIKPDWLLIYVIDGDSNQIIFERTGSHSDLFR